MNDQDNIAAEGAAEQSVETHPFQTIFDKFTEAKKEIERQIDNQDNESGRRELYMTQTKLEEAALWLGQASFMLSTQELIAKELNPDENE